MNNERKMSYVMEYQFFVRKRKDIQNLNQVGSSFGIGRVINTHNCYGREGRIALGRKPDGVLLQIGEMGQILDLNSQAPLRGSEVLALGKQMR